MSQHYSDPSRENDPHALPDVWVTELTAEEIAGNMEDEIHDYMRRPEFKLASMNSRTRDKMALKRAKAIAESRGFKVYHQGDPRGCALYLYRQTDLEKLPWRNDPDKVPDIDSCYNSVGTAIVP